MINKTYDVDHARKGKFRILVTNNSSEEWVVGVLVEGSPKLLSKTMPNYERGETMTLRRSLCTFTEVKK